MSITLQTYVCVPWGDADAENYCVTNSNLKLKS